MPRKPKPILAFPDQVAAQSQFVRNYALKLTMCPEKAADLTQDVMIKALTNEEKFTPTHDGSLKAWLYRITFNTFVNGYRRNVKGKFTTDITAPILDDGLLSHSFHNDGEQAVFIEEIEEQLTHLPEQMERVIRYRIAGYKYEEIADLESVPVGTIKNRIFKGREILLNPPKRSYRKSQPQNKIVMQPAIIAPKTPFHGLLTSLSKEFDQNFKRFDRLTVAKSLGLTIPNLDASLNYLVEHGYVEKQRQLGRGGFMSLRIVKDLSVEPEVLQNVVKTVKRQSNDDYIGSQKKKALPEIQWLTNKPDPTPASPPKLVTELVAANPEPTAIEPDKRIGLLFTDGSIRYFHTVEEATGNVSESVPCKLIQVLGEVQMKPTLVLY